MLRYRSTRPDPLESISILSQAFGSRMLVGAGTLTDAKLQVLEVAVAVGLLIVTPHDNTEIVRTAKAMSLFAVPGFFNPTEAFTLLDAGADATQTLPFRGTQGIPMLKAPAWGSSQRMRLSFQSEAYKPSNIAPWMSSAGAQGVGAGSSISINRVMMQEPSKPRLKPWLMLYLPIGPLPQKKLYKWLRQWPRNFGVPPGCYLPLPPAQL